MKDLGLKVKFLGKAVLFLSSVFCLAACNEASLSWSPDGNCLALTGSGGQLRFADAEGNLSAAAGKAELFAWLPDSSGIIQSSITETNSWQAARPLLSEAQCRESESLAEYIKGELGKNRAVETIGEDKRIKSAPALILESALLCLRDCKSNNLRDLLGEKNWKSLEPEKWTLKRSTLSILRGASVSFKAEGEKSSRKEIWHGFDKPAYLSISPCGKFLLFTAKSADSEAYSLQLLALSSGAKASKLFDSPCKQAEWSADSKKIYFVKSGAAFEGKPTFGALASIEILDEEGELLKEREAPSELLYFALDDFFDLRCLKDGSILFTSSEPQLPSTHAQLSVLRNLFSFKEGDSMPRKLLPVSEAQKNRILSPLRLNSDQSLVMMGRSEDLPVLDLKSGKLKEYKINPKVEPCFRLNNELCFAAPLKDTGSGSRKSEIVLHSIASGKEKTLSSSWPETFVREIMTEKTSN